MKKFFANIFRGLLRMSEDTEEILCETKPQEEIEQESTPKAEENVITADLKKIHKEPNKKVENPEAKRGDTGKAVVAYGPRNLRDIMELMEVPIVSLSKHRTAPII